METDGEGAFLVIVRTLRGTVWPGVKLHEVREAAGKERPADLTVRRIWLFQREIDLLSPGSTGRLRITGDPGGDLAEDSVLVGRTNDEAPLT
ncbi:hypothetical protein ETD83_30780 [Actinomadura soli]|uniref:Uncharacterized protein n=1 Tax=Actinomadura soli TaxID=2508997 RepID=A0A5C4J4S4_9ACTN|nr:hypothetical protein [Actinomadura soli]TMQ91455.1 hypothetical protein ETD83_30780 [Actinomadura soli]